MELPVKKIVHGNSPFFTTYLGSALTLNANAIYEYCKPGVQLCVTAEAVDTIVGLKRLIFFSLFVCLNSFVLIHICRDFQLVILQAQSYQLFCHSIFTFVTYILLCYASDNEGALKIVYSSPGCILCIHGYSQHITQRKSIFITIIQLGMVN